MVKAGVFFAELGAVAVSMSIQILTIILIIQMILSTSTDISKDPLVSLHLNSCYLKLLVSQSKFSGTENFLSDISSLI